MRESYQKLIAVSVVVLAVGAVVFGVLVLRKLERITQAAERSEAKLDMIIEAAAPVGRVAVEKGEEALREIDGKELGKSATEGLKDIGEAAKGRVIRFIKEHSEEE